MVVRLWDLRRLIVPLTSFIEKPFQNWTRDSTNLIGTVLLYVDFTAPIEAIRATRLVLDKIREETLEIDEALAGGDKAAIQEEIGDLLFVIANLARHVDADPEGCLNAANAKFERRFKGIEEALEVQGRNAKDATLEELEALWQAVKRAERAGG